MTEPTENLDDAMKAIIDSDPAALERVRQDPVAYGRMLDLLREIEHGNAIIPDRIAALVHHRAMAAFDRQRAAAPVRLAAQMAGAAAPVGGPAGVGTTRGIHALFVDPARLGGHIRPLFVRLVEADRFDVIARVDCDPVMRAAAARAVRSAIDVLNSVGFEAPGPGVAVEWWVEGKSAAYEGASIGLAIALATAAVFAGLPIDTGTVVSGAVDGDRVLPVGGVAAKYKEVSRTGFDRLILPADSRSDLPADARSAKTPRLSLISTLRQGVEATLGPALGIRAPRLVADSRPAGVTDAQLEVWVELASGQSHVGTRSISMEPVAPLTRWTVGDTLQIGVRATADCHVAIVNVGPTGSITPLVPSVQRPDLTLSAHRTLFFPTPDDGFRFTLQGPPGRERLIAVATRQPIHMALPALVRPPAGPDPNVALFAALADPAVIARATVDFMVDSPPATRSAFGVSRGTADVPGMWRSFDF